jgi:hypothetical protein
MAAFSSSSTRRLILIAAVAALPCLALSLFLPFYQTNDDVAMRLIAEGHFVPDVGSTPFVMLMNVVAGEIISTGYRLLPLLPWYDLFLGACMLAASTALLFVWSGTGGWEELAWAALLALFFLLPAFVSVQYSLAGLGCGLAGVALMALTIVQPQAPPAQRRSLIAGAALFILGTLIRFEGAVLMAIEGALLVLPLIIVSWKDDGARSRRRRAAIAAGIALAAAGLGFALNQVAYARAPGWREFHEYNFRRGRLAEYISDDRVTPDRLERLASEVGWSNIDFALFRSWFFTDPELFSLSRVRRAEAVLFDAAAPASPQATADRFQRAVTLGKSFVAEAMLALVVLVAFLLARARGRLIAYAVAVILTLALLIAGITFALKAPPPRVFQPMLLLAATMLVIASRRLGRSVHPAVNAGALLVAALSTSAALWTLHDESDARRRGHQFARDDVTQMARAGAAFFILHGGAFPLEDYWRPLHVENESFPFVALGVSARTPMVQQSLRRTGRTDLPLSLCSEPGLVIVGNADITTLLTGFVQEHHYLKVRFVPAFKGPRFTAWRCERQPAS